MIRYITKNSMIELNATLGKYSNIDVYTTIAKPITHKQVENRTLPIFRDENGKLQSYATVKLEWHEIAMFLDILKVLKQGQEKIVQFIDTLKKKYGNNGNLSFYHANSILGFDIAATKDGNVLGAVFFILKDKERYQVLFRYEDYNTEAFRIQFEYLLQSMFAVQSIVRREYFKNNKQRNNGNNTQTKQQGGIVVDESDIMQDIQDELIT